jgi:hypothetical protein
MWRYDYVDHYEVSDDLGDHDYEHYGVSAPDDDLGDHDPFPHYDLGDHDPFPHHHDLPAHDLPALNRWVPARGTLSMRFRPTIHTRAGAHYPDGSYGAGCLDPPSVEQWSVSTRVRSLKEHRMTREVFARSIGQTPTVRGHIARDLRKWS